MNFCRFLPICPFIFSLSAVAQTTDPPNEAEPKQLETMVVTGKAESLVGIANSASKGQTNHEELMQRPYLRRGEILESIPGVVITQHSGEGKANQYFVRGFNLDHGTDFNISMDGQPVNFVTHAHGQGYADLNPIIPELVESLDYWKGPFYGEVGDLSTAGAAKFNFYDMLPQGIASVGLGQNHYFHGLLADSIDLSASTPTNGAILTAPGNTRSGLTYALEYNEYDGPWLQPGNSQRINGFLKYFRESGPDKFSLTAMGYHGRWDSTDQIPQRAIDSGLVNRLGNLDDGLGGNSARYSLMGQWDHQNGNGKTHADLYVGHYDFDLFSNFTYFLDNSKRGDQFEQQDNRIFAGGQVTREWDLGAKDHFKIGLQSRNDFINGIGLYNTENKQRFNTIKKDDIYESSLGIFSTGEWHVNDWFRVQPGLRADGYYFNVASNDTKNSGHDTAGIISPKLSLIFGPWADTEFYANVGTGFHSNDARGVTLAAGAADPLVRTYGYELGVRTEAVSQVVSTLALFYLHSDSELIYVGDAGSAEAGPASARYGVEWSAYWHATDWLVLDNEVTMAKAKLLGVGNDDDIPGAVPLTMNTGITLGKEEGFFGSLRSRYFSPRPLIENGSVESRQSWQMNARVGYRKNDWEVAVDCLNLLGRKDNDIEYYYNSRLPGEAVGGVADIHLHPAEPQTFRISVTRKF
jgi:TonB-dependent Receptor Plug Domain